MLDCKFPEMKVLDGHINPKMIAHLKVLSMEFTTYTRCREFQLLIEEQKVRQ